MDHAKGVLLDAGRSRLVRVVLGVRLLYGEFEAGQYQQAGREAHDEPEVPAELSASVGVLEGAADVQQPAVARYEPYYEHGQGQADADDREAERYGDYPADPEQSGGRVAQLATDAC